MLCSNIVFGGNMADVKKSRAGGVSLGVARLILLATFLSFLGWCFEVVRQIIFAGHFPDRGLLSLPLCPIYGISIVAIYLLIGTPASPSGVIGARLLASEWWKKNILTRPLLRLPLYFLFVTFLSSAAELVTGLVSKALGSPLWDYSGKPLNLFGVICLEYSLLWGVGLTLFMMLLWKPLYRAFCRIPSKAAKWIAIWLSIPVSIDFLVNVIYLIVLGKRM